MSRLLVLRVRLWAAMGLVALAIAVVLVQQDAPWIGDALWGQETIGAAQILTLPVVGCLGALDGRMDGSGILAIFASNRERLSHMGLRIGAWAVGALVVYGLAHVVVWALSARAQLAFGNGSGWPVITQWLAAVLAYMVSYAIGATFRSWGSIIFAAALWPALLLAAQTGTLPNALSEFGGGGTMLGLRVEPVYFFARSSWLLALTALSAMWVLVRMTGRRGLGVSGLGVCMVLLGALAFTSTGYSYQVLKDDVCAGESPRLCGPSVLGGRIEEVAPVLSQAAAVVRGMEVGPPTRMVAWTPSVPTTANEVSVYDPGRIRSRVSTREMVSAVVAPRSCSLWSGESPPPTEWFTAERLVTDAVLRQLEQREASGVEAALLRRVGAARTHDVISQSAAALSECDAARIPHALKAF